MNDRHFIMVIRENRYCQKFDHSAVYRAIFLEQRMNGIKRE
jgi:hypothetical protein